MSNEAPKAVHIAIVEDDPEIRELVAGYLRREGFEVSDCADGAAFDGLAARCAQEGRVIDLVVLDLMMPGEDGLSICRRIAPAVPVLVLSAKGEEVDRIIGLEVGADDYLPKPFNPRELVARIRAVLRRRAGPSAPPPRPAPLSRGDDAPREILAFAGWRLDVDGRRLSDPEGRDAALSAGELALLIEFARRPRRVLTRDQLLDWTRGRDADAYDRAIDVQLSRLRRKLKAAGADDLIRTIRGDGYLFDADVEQFDG